MNFFEHVQWIFAMHASREDGAIRSAAVNSFYFLSEIKKQGKLQRQELSFMVNACSPVQPAIGRTDFGVLAPDSSVEMCDLTSPIANPMGLRVRVRDGQTLLDDNLNIIVASKVARLREVQIRSASTDYEVRREIRSEVREQVYH